MKSAGRIRRLLRACGSVDSHVPLGRALLDHLQSGEDVDIEVFRSDGVAFTMRSSEFFSLEGRLMALDERALEECRGRVLDVGAGAGRHSLVLQERGIDVVALDISPLCGEVMRRRGVRDVRVGDAFGLGVGGQRSGWPCREARSTTSSRVMAERETSTRSAASMDTLPVTGSGTDMQ